jgi:hypothetical protein
MVHEWHDKQKLAGSAVGAGLFFLIRDARPGAPREAFH